MQYLLVTSRSSCCQVFPQGIHLIARLQCSALRLSPTMASADFSQFVVTAADGTACETSRDKSSVFPRLPARFTRLGYGCLLDFAVLRQLIRQTRLISGFCSSGYDFAIPSSRLHLAVQTLGVALGFVGNYAPCGLSPQTDGMSVIQQKASCCLQDASQKLGWKDSNLQMQESESCALPFGDSPICIDKRHYIILHRKMQALF